VVRLLSDGNYEALGPVDHGAHLSGGLTAVLEVGGVEVMVCEGRSGLNDPEMLRRAGIEPSRRRILCIKGLGTFRAAFGSIIGEALMVDGVGAAPQDLASLPYQHVRRPIEPLDNAVDFDASRAALVVHGREW
jgi:microcystin degradation protein MlrC